MEVYVVLCSRVWETTEGDLDTKSIVGIYAKEEDAQKVCQESFAAVEIREFEPPTQEEFERSTLCELGYTYIEHVEYMKKVHDMYQNQLQTVEYYVHKMEVL